MESEWSNSLTDSQQIDKRAQKKEDYQDRSRVKQRDR